MIVFEYKLMESCTEKKRNAPKRLFTRVSNTSTPTKLCVGVRSDPITPLISSGRRLTMRPEISGPSCERHPKN
jgi:hypothetical protein